jgi:hypothetical protein
VYGERISIYRFLVRKPDGKKKLGRSKCRWENDSKIDFQG